MYDLNSLSEKQLHNSYDLDSIFNETFDVSGRVFTGVDITQLKLAMIQLGDDYDAHQRALNKERGVDLELIHTRYLRQLNYVLGRKKQYHQMRLVLKAQFQYVSWWSRSYIPTRREHLSNLWLFWKCRKAYSELANSNIINDAQHLYKGCVQTVHGYQEPRINFHQIRYDYKQRFPELEKDDKGNTYLSFVTVKNSRYMLAGAIVLWYVHRQSADDALFFFTYQNHRSAVLKKWRKFLPKSFMLAHCQHNLRCNQIKLENQYYYDRFEVDEPVFQEAS